MERIALLKFATCALVFPVLSASASARPRKVSVLVVGGVHSKYVAQPLHKLGIEIDTCRPAELGSRLATKKYNVVLPHTPLDEKTRDALDRFMDKGGGVFLTLFGPGRKGAKQAQEQWEGLNRWLAGYGAELRWEVLSDRDRNNVVSDVMGARFTWTDRISPPVNDGVEGVLILMARPGWFPPMPFLYGEEWRIVVRTAPSVKSYPAKEVKDPLLIPFIPEEAREGELPILGIREVGKGRMALLGMGRQWIWNPPGVCPTAEAMLSRGAGGKASYWIGVLANTFRWLAQPSRKRGYGGAKTPKRILQPVKVWKDHPKIEWKRVPYGNFPPMSDQPQLVGVVGARSSLSSGKGTVEEFAKYAKEAGLDFIVFLEDALKMDEGKFGKLVAECQAVSDDSFAAIPGLLLEDAQGNHLYTFGDNTLFPKSEMLLPDGRLDTTNVSRMKVLFDYIIQYLRYRNVFGFYRHKENFLPVADYKLYNSFPIYSFLDGKQIDDAFEEYLYLMGWSGCQGVLALELITDPRLVPVRAKEGWRVVATVGNQISDGTYKPISSIKGVRGLREKWAGSLGWWPPYQYITNGPRILSWTVQNNCVIPSGEWWRPDLWEYRARLHASSDVGLKSVTIYEGDRGIYRRWLLNGEKEFEHTFVLSNSQQIDLVPVVEDIKGRKAIGMEVWNRNTMLNQFICGDRCNFLGDCRLRRKDGSAVWLPVGFAGNLGISPSKGELWWGMAVQPAISLTPGAPTLPIDGRPIGFQSAKLRIAYGFPGEYPRIFSYPTQYLISPEIGVGQGNFKLAYDPAERGARRTPLGHPYKDPEKQGGFAPNSWTSWYRLIPTKVLSGWSRNYACNALEYMRLGWHSAHLILKQDIRLGKDVSIMSATGRKWELYRGRELLADSTTGQTAGLFTRGTYAIDMNPGGSTVVIGMGGRVSFRHSSGSFSLAYSPPYRTLKKGSVIEFSFAWLGVSGTIPKGVIFQTLEILGVTNPGYVGYDPELNKGETIDNYLIWRVDGGGEGISAHLPKVNLECFLCLSVENLNDNWSVYLVDGGRKGPNFRALPVRDGRSYAQLDLTEHPLDIFVGHPITADNSEVKILVSWMEPRKWFVEVHNPTDSALDVALRSVKDWKIFKFKKEIKLPPGSSKVWILEGRK